MATARRSAEGELSAGHLHVGMPSVADIAGVGRGVSARRAGVGDLITRQGGLYVFPDRAAFEAEALSWRIRRENGTRWLELDEDELRQREPALNRRRIRTRSADPNAAVICADKNIGN